MAAGEERTTGSSHEPAWKVLLAFAVIYFVWGSTFLAIRISVHEIPPLLLATMRFFTAGVLLFGFMLLRGEPWPRSREWASCFLLGALIFVGDYGLLFWAEKHVPSGIAAVMMATIPVFVAIAEIALLRTLRFTGRLALALLIGLGGVGVLMSRSLHLGDAPVDLAGAAALIVASMFWALATVLTRKLPLPGSKATSAGAQMVAGGLLLIAATVLHGDLRGFEAGAVTASAWAALAYLIVAGSLLGFTAYVWLIHRESPTKVGTYAYVNPVVAVLLGYFAAGEPLGLRTLLGTLLILVSVVVITLTKSSAADMATPPRTAVEEQAQARRR